MWSALDDALDTQRHAEALRLAVSLWGQCRAPSLADLIDALAAFVDSDPRSAPPDARRTDAAAFDGWLLNAAGRALGIWGDGWWLRDWEERLRIVHTVFEASIRDRPDPRLARVILGVVVEPIISNNALVLRAGGPFIELLVELADGRILPAMMEMATSPALGARVDHLMAPGIEALEKTTAAMPRLAPREEAIVAGGLARYRDEPQRWIDMIIDPARARDDGTEEVSSDALSELGHPYGEAIALQYDATNGVITSAGRERLATLLACHEQRWLGRDLVLSLEERSYRGGLLDEGSLRPASKRFPVGAALRRVLDDPRLARLRVLRAGAEDWDSHHASALRESRWLTRSLEWLDVPTVEFLYAACTDPYPNIVGLRLSALHATRFDPRWAGWPHALASWLEILPSIREVVFQKIPENGLEGLIEGIVGHDIHRKVGTLTLDARARSWVQTGTRDATQWLLLLAPHAVTRATLHVLVASLSVEWTPAGLVVTLETSEGGEAFDLLTKLPAQDIARLVLREHPGKRARQRLESLGRLKRLIATLAPREVVMPVRWKNWLTALDRIR